MRVVMFSLYFGCLRFKWRSSNPFFSCIYVCCSSALRNELYWICHSPCIHELMHQPFCPMQQTMTSIHKTFYESFMHNMLLYTYITDCAIHHTEFKYMWKEKLNRTHRANGYENFIATIILLFFTYKIVKLSYLPLLANCLNFIRLFYGTWKEQLIHSPPFTRSQSQLMCQKLTTFLERSNHFQNLAVDSFYTMDVQQQQ